jgi:hypothetical protein
MSSNNSYRTPTERGKTDVEEHGHRATGANEMPAPKHMRKVSFVFIEQDLLDWVKFLVAETGFSASTVMRNQLRLAYKYRRAIADAERAPERFRSMGRNNGL